MIRDIIFISIPCGVAGFAIVYTAWFGVLRPMITAIKRLRSENSMKQYEYREWFYEETEDYKLTDFLNDVGNQGWLLVGSLWYQGKEVRGLFCREKKVLRNPITGGER